MGKQRISKRGKISDKHIIVCAVIAIVILMGILFRAQIGSMFRSIFGGSGSGKDTELTGTNIIFEVGKSYSLEHIDSNVYKITDRKGKSVKFAELEQNGSEVIFQDKDGRRHKFFVSESAMYLGTEE
ncbi:MAG: hypothetical protein GX494_06970 [Clostridiaceae bacterium]|nr:hypothetical protein [Clostridiaceae bacterium]